MNKYKISSVFLILLMVTVVFAGCTSEMPYDENRVSLEIGFNENLGTVEVEGEEVEPGEEFIYNHGTEVKLKAIPDEGAEFVEWSNVDETEEEITIVMDEDLKVNAVFADEFHSVSLISLEGEGTVEVDGEVLAEETDSVEVPEGEVTIEAVPDTGWEFESWGEDAEEETEAEFTTTIEDDYDIGVTFEFIQYTLTVDIAEEERDRGIIEVDGEEVDLPYEEDYDAGAEVDLEAIAEDEYEFTEWEVNEESYDEPEITVTMDEDKDAVASFREIDDPYFDVEITATNSPVIAGEDLEVDYTVLNDGGIEDTQDIEFTITDEDGGEVYSDTEEDVNLDPNEDFSDTFTWSTEEEDIGEYTAEVSSEDDSDEVDVEVVEGHDVSLVDLEGEGTVEVNREVLEEETDSVKVPEGEVTIEAIPDAGYEFESWGEDAAGETETEFTTTIDDDYDIGVTFDVTVKEIEVTEQPKLDYVEGQELDLSGMEVTETYPDDSEKTVEFGDGDWDANYTAEPEDGTELTVEDHDGESVTVTHEPSGETADTNELTVGDITLEEEEPFSGEWEEDFDRLRVTEGALRILEAADFEGELHLILPEDVVFAEDEGDVSENDSEVELVPGDYDDEYMSVEGDDYIVDLGEFTLWDDRYTEYEDDPEDFNFKLEDGDEVEMDNISVGVDYED